MEEPLQQQNPLRKVTRFAGKLIWELVTTVVPALMLALFINVFVAEAALVESGPSMQPNLYQGDRVLCD